jgi:hypothetical protein
VDPHHIDADPNAYPDPDFYLKPGCGSGFFFDMDADPYPDPGYQNAADPYRFGSTALPQNMKKLQVNEGLNTFFLKFLVLQKGGSIFSGTVMKLKNRGLRSLSDTSTSSTVIYFNKRCRSRRR